MFLSCIKLMQVAFAIKRSGGKDQDGSEVFEWFERYVVPSKLDVSINQIELVSIKNWVLVYFCSGFYLDLFLLEVIIICY